MRKMLGTCVLVFAITCAAQAADGEIQNGLATHIPDTAGEIHTPLIGKLPDTGIEILSLLESLLFLF